MTTTRLDAAPVQRPRRLTHLPLALFAAPMGLGGAALAWREAARIFGAPAAIGETLVAVTLFVWLLVAGLQLVRIVGAPGALVADLRHPVRSAFAGAATIGLMTVAGGLLPYAPSAAAAIWLVAVAVHLVIGVWMFRGLLSLPREAAALTPPLLIPLVGSVVAPIMGVPLGFETLSWVLFGVGGLLWILVQSLIFGRIVTGPSLPEPLRPTLVILLAPPAAATVALAKLTHGFGPAPLILFGLAVFIAAVLASMAGRFARVPFSVSWWAWTFPTSLFAATLLLLAEAHRSVWTSGLAWIALLAASGVLLKVSLATIAAARSGALLRSEGG
ncbi:SLAC1 anion channel family protein [Aquabacter spiritensis]|uniref:Tellurite resistance protein n=1 Tax=Aquabacter spiritensis TaxID=933073 RepID=A0A4R3LR32_9HYPH|nr:SLAC1 anion channel family protein [Aquabacter spiritensis]TCT02932.1 tellurite resistance protein [Aquabacter spiritensis]